MGPEFGPVFGASEYWHFSRELRKRFGACILVLANHFQAHFENRTIWTRSNHFFSNMQPENSKVQSQLMLALNTFCGPEHLAKNPFPQSRVFLAKQAQTLAFRPGTCRGPRFCRQNRRGPCSGLLGITKKTIGTYPNGAASPAFRVALAHKLSYCMGEGGVRIRVERAIPMSSPLKT